MKNLLIVGASSGIGAALSARLSSSCSVYGTWCKNKPDTSVSEVHYSYLNVLDESPDFSFLPDQLHALVYCPGIIALKPFNRIRPDDFMEDYKLQVIGAVRCIQAALPALKASGNATVLLFSTVAVQTGFPFHSLVSSSKGALEGLTKSLAAELAPFIRVNCIAPGLTNTPLAKSLLNTPEKMDANAARHPLKRIGQPEDLASMAAYLINDESSWISGQVFHVDGGMSALRI